MPPRGGKQASTVTEEELQARREEIAAEDAAQTGDGGAREEEVSEAQKKFDAMHEQIDLGDEAGLVVRNATDWVIELFKHRPKAWDQLSQIEQRDLCSGIEENVKELVRHVVEAIARTGRDAVRCLFVGFTDKGDDIKAELKLKAFSREEAEAAVISFHRARGKHVLVTVASADDFHDNAGVDRSEPDQHSLGFAAGSDEHPEDDSDLVDAAGDDITRHGDKLDVTGYRVPVTARINLKEAMVQILPPDADEINGWVDLREATPAELAAERERVSDFVGDEQEETDKVEA